MFNRANGGLRFFKNAEDFAAFEQLVAEVHERFPLRILSYVVLGDHWHFVVWPQRGKEELLSDFFRTLTITHAQRWHAAQGTTGMGHVYQGRFKSFPIAVRRTSAGRAAVCREQSAAGGAGRRRGSLAAGEACTAARKGPPKSGPC